MAKPRNHVTKSPVLDEETVKVVSPVTPSEPVKQQPAPVVKKQTESLVEEDIEAIGANGALNIRYLAAALNSFVEVVDGPYVASVSAGVGAQRQLAVALRTALEQSTDEEFAVNMNYLLLYMEKHRKSAFSNRRSSQWLGHWVMPEGAADAHGRLLTLLTDLAPRATRKKRLTNRVLRNELSGQSEQLISRVANYFHVEV